MAKNEKVKFATMRSVMFFGLIGILSIAMLYLFRPFFYPIFWAAVIAIMFYPLYKWLNKHIKAPSVNATLMIPIVLAVLFIPLFLLSLLVINESVKLVTSISESGVLTSHADVSNSVTAFVEKTALAPYMERISERLPEYISTASQYLGSAVVSAVGAVTQNSLRFFMMFFIMLYTLFYFFRDGDKLLKRLMHISPLGDKYEAMLFEKFTSTTRATLKGTFIVGGIQGLLGGILFWVTGIQGVLVWGVLMTALSIIPAVGSFIIWAPAGIFLLLSGAVWQGLTILIFGVVVIGNIDNFLRPALVGKDIEMHPLVVLFSTLGGIFIFGISGFIIGPIIAALYMAMVSIYGHYYQRELSNN